MELLMNPWNVRFVSLLRKFRFPLNYFFAVLSYRKKKKTVLSQDDTNECVLSMYRAYDPWI